MLNLPEIKSLLYPQTQALNSSTYLDKRETNYSRFLFKVKGTALNKKIRDLPGLYKQDIPRLKD